jgi:DNA replication licensing factor MCM2
MTCTAQVYVCLDICVEFCVWDGTANKQSLEVSYADLSERYQVLAVWIADVPRVLLEIFHKAAREVVLDDFPDFSHIHSEIFVRMAGLPITDQIRDLR